MLKRREFLATSAAAAVVVVMPAIGKEEPKKFYTADYVWDVDSYMLDRRSVKLSFERAEKYDGIRLGSHRLDMDETRYDHDKQAWFIVWSAEVIG